MLRVGDRVLAAWPAEEEWWYPGVICGMAGFEVDVQYDDGDRATLSQSDVRPLALGIGSRVWGRWQAEACYYPGTITRQLGAAIHIDYDDGDAEWTTIGMVRVHIEDVPRH